MTTDLKKLKEIASKKWDVAYVPSPMQLGPGDKVIIDDKEDITAVLIGGRSNDIMAMKEALPELISKVESLSDIPKIREEIQAINGLIEKLWKASTVEELQAEWPKINDARVAFCKKYFGSDLEVDGQYLDPEIVLDWIEYFIKRR
jgi:hypothetical protein